MITKILEQFTNYWLNIVKYLFDDIKKFCLSSLIENVWCKFRTIIMMNIAREIHLINVKKYLFFCRYKR